MEERSNKFFERARAHGFSGCILIVTAATCTGKWTLWNCYKYTPPSELVEAIRRVLAGEVWLDLRSDSFHRRHSH
jgi:hypothetical protein